MAPDINYLAVLAAAVSNMVLGFLWYGPVFGTPWKKEMGFTDEKMKEMTANGASMTRSYALMIIGALVMAYVMAHSMIFAVAFLGITGVSAGLQGGFWNWLGFVAPVTLGAVLWENRSWKLWFINAGYYLVALCIMGVILAVWP